MSVPGLPGTHGEQAVLNLQASSEDPLPTLREIIKECPRTAVSDLSINDHQFETALQLSSQICNLLKNGKGSVPQVSALALCCVLPATIGITETAVIFASTLKNKNKIDESNDSLLASLLQNIKTALTKQRTAGDGLCESMAQLDVREAGSSDVSQGCQEASVVRLHLANAAMQCPNSRQLTLRPYGPQPGEFLLKLLFEVIAAAAVSFKTRSHPSTLKALTLWLTAAKCAVNPTRPSEGWDNLASPSSIAKVIFPCLSRCLCIINSCLWDSKAFGILLDLSESIRANCGEELQLECKVTSANLLLCTMFEMPWRSKRKLQMLAELLPRCGVKQVISDFPEVSKGLVESLAYNELQATCADVYKALLKAMPQKEFGKHFTAIHIACLNDPSAIQGFTNYWLPALAKKFPGLVKCLEKEVKGNILAQIILLQAQRRENLVTIQEMLENTDYYHLLCDGMTVYDVNVRARTFSTLCTGIGQSIAAMPPEIMNIALKLAHGFIMDNISVTSQAARHSIVRSVMFLLPAVRDFLAFAMKNIAMDMDLLKTEETKPASSFLRWLFHFVVHNLEPGTNYQRHITSLRLYHAAMQTFSVQASTTKVPVKELIKSLKRSQCWLFESPSGINAVLRCVLSPTDDVRITAANILLSNEAIFRGLPCGDNLMAEGLLLCLNQQFSVVEGGAMLFIVGSHFTAHSHTRLLPDLLLEAKRQFNILQQGLLKGALEESPVHGVLQAMLYLLQQERDPPMPISFYISVLDMIETVVEHLLKLLTSRSTTQEFAPSFEDMDWAIEAQVYQNYNVEEKSIQVSPHYQLALNCAWLNLKVCSEVASFLGCMLSRNKEKNKLVERCGHILMTVLQKCRHKGAFEAAGVALGNFVRTTSANGCQVHVQLLERLLAILSLRGDDAPPLSRRSAGLAIAVHKIVASDTDKDKNLVHRVVEQMLMDLSAEEVVEAAGTSQAAFVDAPSARLMHVLFTLVSDAALRNHMAPHLERVALAALCRLNSSNWGIRNAAMQLFGAVVCKLTAQHQSRKGDDDEEMESEEDDWDMVGSGLLEDLQLSRPALLAHLLSQLSAAVQNVIKDGTIMRNHTSLVFHLGLVVRLTPGPPSLRTPQQAEVVESILASCWALLGCSEWTVRVQAAECVLTLTSVPDIPQLLARAQHVLKGASENKKHGCLLLINRAEIKISLFLQLLPRQLGLYTCNINSVTSKKAQIKPTGSYVCHQYVKFKDIKKGDFFRIIRELSKYPCSKHVSKMLWTANMVESVVLTQKSIPSPEILDKCLEAESLYYIQERVLSTMYTMINYENKLLDQMLEIQLILYETLDQVMIARSCSRHLLLLIIKVLVAIKRKTTEKFVKDIMPEFIPSSKAAKDLESANKIKQWIVLCGETLWVQPLISLLESDIYGDEFELFALELLGLHLLELMAAGYAQESVDVLTALAELLQQNLMEEIPDRSSIGRALAAISPVVWNLQQLCSHHKVSAENVGYTILQATGELLSEHNFDASMSIWPISAKRNGIALNPVFCLRQMCKLGAEKLMTSRMLYTYLWQQLTVNVEELKQSVVAESDVVVSPFSQGTSGMDFETFDFIASGFKYLDYFRKHLMNMDPQMAALLPDHQIHLPGSSIQEFRINTKELVDSIAVFRQKATGPLQWLPSELQIAIRKLTLQLWIHLETVQEHGIDLRLTDLDGTTAEERVYRLRRHLNTRNQLDMPDYS